MLWTECSGGKWATPNEAVFVLAPSVGTEELQAQVVSLLSAGGFPLIQGLPEHILQGGRAKGRGFGRVRGPI